jgi:uncharacterized protein YbjT (DUF2867 family)
MKIGPFPLVPAMTIKPVALDAVAEVIAECATGARSGPLHEVAGPEMTTLWRMTRQLPGKCGTPIPLAIPTRYGRAFRGGTLVAGDGVEVVGPTFSEWLSTRSS